MKHRPPPDCHTFTQVPPIAVLLTQPDVPMYVVTMSLQILSVLTENGESTLQELCKVPALPAALASFIERVCDDPAAQNSVDLPKLFVENLIKLLCNIVIKACCTGRLQPSGSPDPSFTHAQALRSTCLRLFKRFKPLLVEDASLSQLGQPAIKVTMPRYFLSIQ